MKRSSKIGLLFLGSAMVLSGCSNDGDGWDSSELNNVDVPVQQKYYTSLDDCKKDWSKENANPGQDINGKSWDNLCEFVPDKNTQTASTSSHGGSGFYMGPRYYNSPNGGVELLGFNNRNSEPLRFNAPNSGRSFFSSSSNIKASQLSPSSHVVQSVKSASIARSSVARGGFGSARGGFSSGG